MSSKDSKITNQNSYPFSCEVDPQFFEQNKKGSSNQSNNFSGIKRKYQISNSNGIKTNRNKFFKNTAQPKIEKEFDVRHYYDRSMLEDPWTSSAAKF